MYSCKTLFSFLLCYVELARAEGRRSANSRVDQVRARRDAGRDGEEAKAASGIAYEQRSWGHSCEGDRHSEKVRAVSAHPISSAVTVLGVVGARSPRHKGWRTTTPRNVLSDRIRLHFTGRSCASALKIEYAYIDHARLPGAQPVYTTAASKYSADEFHLP